MMIRVFADKNPNMLSAITIPTPKFKKRSKNPYVMRRPFTVFDSKTTRIEHTSSYTPAQVIRIMLAAAGKSGILRAVAVRLSIPLHTYASLLMCVLFAFE